MYVCISELCNIYHVNEDRLSHHAAVTNSPKSISCLGTAYTTSSPTAPGLLRALGLCHHLFGTWVDSVLPLPEAGASERDKRNYVLVPKDLSSRSDDVTMFIGQRKSCGCE